MTDLVLSGLLTRRAELLKEAKAAEAAYHRLVEDIGHPTGWRFAFQGWGPGYGDMGRLRD